MENLGALDLEFGNKATRNWIWSWVEMGWSL